MTSSRSEGNLQEKAYEYVKEKIMKRAFTPGQIVTHNQLARDLNISRTPVYAALLRLEQEGFISNNPGQGWKVYALSLQDIHDIFEIKLQLEGLICKKAAGCRDKKMRAKLKTALKNMQIALKGNDLKAWQKADMELHDIIFDMCANKRAIRIIKDLNDQWYRVKVGLIALEGRMRRSTAEHETIVKSILDNDENSAESSMCHHLIKLQEELVNVLTNLILPFAQNGI